MVFGGKFRIRRCNSKASYLPRQSLEKLNNSDPDHGSYKLTLTSNEDLVNSTNLTKKPPPPSVGAYDILVNHNGKLPPPPTATSQQHTNNLPDVLPLNAKLHQGLNVSPTSSVGGGGGGGGGISKGTPLRYAYGSNSSISSTNHQTHQMGNQMYPPLQHRYSTPTMSMSATNTNTTSVQSAYNGNNNHQQNNQQQQPSSTALNYQRSQSYDNNNSRTNNANKFMSQSTIDLKSPRLHLLDTTHEEDLQLPQKPTTTTESGNNNHLKNSTILSAAQSENNLIDTKCRNSLNKTQPLMMMSSPKSNNDFNSNEQMHHANANSSGGNNSSSSVSTEGRIFRAELVSTTFPTGSPALSGSLSSLNNTTNNNKNTKNIIRKESLRENIEKITQLQSKLMSAHLNDSNGFSGVGVAVYATKLQSQSNQSIAENEEHSNSEAALNEETKPANNEQKMATTNSPTAEISKTTVDTPPTSTFPTSATSTITSTPSLIDDDSNENSLKLMQRSELILHLNPTMVEASSQTDDLNDDDKEIFGLSLPPHQLLAKEEHQQQHHYHHQQQQQNQQHFTRTTLQPRQNHPIEMDCDKMCLELAALLPSNDKLNEIIAPKLIKTAADYVNNLYNPNVPLRPTKHDVGTSTLMRMKLKDRCGENNEKQKLNVLELHYAELDLTTSLITGNDDDNYNDEGNDEGCDNFKRKVHELIKQLKRKIHILSNEQTTIEEESAINDELGSNLIQKFAEKVRPIEASKFRTYIDDVGHITSLLLSLSERLARAENTLLTLSDNNSIEQKSLETKRDRLLEQLDEAKRLKNDIDRRGSGLISMIEKYFNADDHADFDYFINMKAKLIADLREILYKIKNGEEQLNALNETLVTSDC